MKLSSIIDLDFPSGSHFFFLIIGQFLIKKGGLVIEIIGNCADLKKI